MILFQIFFQTPYDHELNLHEFYSKNNRITPAIKQQYMIQRIKEQGSPMIYIVEDGYEALIMV